MKKHLGYYESGLDRGLAISGEPRWCTCGAFLGTAPVQLSAGSLHKEATWFCPGAYQHSFRGGLSWHGTPHQTCPQEHHVEFDDFFDCLSEYDIAPSGEFIFTDSDDDAPCDFPPGGAPDDAFVVQGLCAWHVGIALTVLLFWALVWMWRLGAYVLSPSRVRRKPSAMVPCAPAPISCPKPRPRHGCDAACPPGLGSGSQHLVTSVFANPIDDLWLHRLRYGPVRHYRHSLWDQADEINEGLEPGDPNFLDLCDVLGPRRPPTALGRIFCGDPTGPGGRRNASSTASSAASIDEVH